MKELRKISLSVNVTIFQSWFGLFFCHLRQAKTYLSVWDGNIERGDYAK